MSRRSSLEVVARARRPSSVSTFSDIFVAVLSRRSGKTAVSILSCGSLQLLILGNDREVSLFVQLEEFLSLFYTRLHCSVV